MMLKVSNKIILKIDTELNRGVILDVEGIYYREYLFRLVWQPCFCCLSSQNFAQT